MSDRDIAAAAMRWHSARARRLVLARQLRGREGESASSLLTDPALRDLQWRFNECKRAERLALSALAKACKGCDESVDAFVIDA